ncbi:MAG TPA: RES domain-containing protein [Vicinamibacterales bacterium]|nr:RES domain-containing protein [Vicinamibacterales bacterium]
MILYRCFAWNSGARERDADGPLWFPRDYQGEGRHDNPDTYGCLYLSDRPVSSVVEQLAAFRGQRLIAALLRRRGLPLALAQLELDDSRTPLLDLDDPAVLRRERLRPSRVATRSRTVTQPLALALFRSHPRAAGLRWWSTWESLWTNVTVFDRAARALSVARVEPLSLEHPAVLEAADFFGLRVV